MSEMKLKELLEKYPFVVDFFESTGFDYTRTKNPTRSILEDTIAKLEKAKQEEKEREGKEHGQDEDK